MKYIPIVLLVALLLACRNGKGGRVKLNNDEEGWD
jgi:hypothetical protein